MLAAVVAVAVVVVVAVALGTHRRPVVREDPKTVPSSSISGWNDSSALPSAGPSGAIDPSGSPSVDPVGSARPAACDQYQGTSRPAPSGAGRVRGGALSFSTLPAGWQQPMPTTRLPYSKNAVYQSQTLPEKLAWEASAYVGQSTIGSDVDATVATNRMLQCVVTSDFYTSVKVRLTENSAKRITVDGVSAVQRDALLRFEHPDLKTNGSRLRFIVVDSSPRSFFFYAVPMERHDLIAELDKATMSLQVS